jgi:hypothetical protein
MPSPIHHQTLSENNILLQSSYKRSRQRIRRPEVDKLFLFSEKPIFSPLLPLSSSSAGQSNLGLLPSMA